MRRLNVQLSQLDQCIRSYFFQWTGWTALRRKAVEEAALEEAGRPMKTQELRRAARAKRGFARDFRVHPCGRVISLGRGIWGLEGRDEGVRTRGSE